MKTRIAVASVISLALPASLFAQPEKRPLVQYVGVNTISINGNTVPKGATHYVGDGGQINAWLFPGGSAYAPLPYPAPPHLAVGSFYDKPRTYGASTEEKMSGRQKLFDFYGTDLSITSTAANQRDNTAVTAAMRPFLRSEKEAPQLSTDDDGNVYFAGNKVSVSFLFPVKYDRPKFPKGADEGWPADYTTALDAGSDNVMQRRVKMHALTMLGYERREAVTEAIASLGKKPEQKLAYSSLVLPYRLNAYLDKSCQDAPYELALVSNKVLELRYTDAKKTIRSLLRVPSHADNGFRAICDGRSLAIVVNRFEADSSLQTALVQEHSDVSGTKEGVYAHRGALYVFEDGVLVGGRRVPGGEVLGALAWSGEGKKKALQASVSGLPYAYEYDLSGQFRRRLVKAPSGLGGCAADSGYSFLYETDARLAVTFTGAKGEEQKLGQIETLSQLFCKKGQAILVASRFHATKGMAPPKGSDVQVTKDTWLSPTENVLLAFNEGGVLVARQWKATDEISEAVTEGKRVRVYLKNDAARIAEWGTDGTDFAYRPAKALCADSDHQFKMLEDGKVELVASKDGAERVLAKFAAFHSGSCRNGGAVAFARKASFDGKNVDRKEGTFFVFANGKVVRSEDAGPTEQEASWRYEKGVFVATFGKDARWSVEMGEDGSWAARAYPFRATESCAGIPYRFHKSGEAVGLIYREAGKAPVTLAVVDTPGESQCVEGQLVLRAKSIKVGEESSSFVAVKGASAVLPPEHVRSWTPDLLTAETDGVSVRFSDADAFAVRWSGGEWTSKMRISGSCSKFQFAAADKGVAISHGATALGVASGLRSVACEGDRIAVVADRWADKGPAGPGKGGAVLWMANGAKTVAEQNVAPGRISAVAKNRGVDAHVRRHGSNETVGISWEGATLYPVTLKLGGECGETNARWEGDSRVRIGDAKTPTRFLLDGAEQLLCRGKRLLVRIANGSVQSSDAATPLRPNTLFAEESSSKALEHSKTQTHFALIFEAGQLVSYLPSPGKDAFRTATATESAWQLWTNGEKYRIEVDSTLGARAVPFERAPLEEHGVLSSLHSNNETAIEKGSPK